MLHTRVAVMSVLGAVVLAGALRCSATVLYYGGDPSYFMPGYSYSSYEGDTSGYDERVYDNFAIPAGTQWNVTGFFAQIADPNYPNGTELGEWEIRTGMSDGNMGTLIASGTSTSGTTSTPTNDFPLNGGLQGQTMTISLSTSVVLQGGQTYWFTLTPQDMETTDHLFVGLSPDHANAVGQPLDNDSLYFDIGSSYNTEYSDDVSAGVLGTTSPTPEPTMVGMVGLMGVALLRKRRRCAAL